MTNQAPSPLLSGDNRKRYRRGTHRTLAPQETVERVKPFMAAMGITRIANVTGLDRLGLPVVTVCRPNARSLAVSQGKGLDLWAAKASALMEAVETFHAEHLALPVRLGSYAELREQISLTDPETLAKAQADHFNENLKLSWIEARNLADGQTSWLPLETVSADYTLPLQPGSGCFAASTNGLASGNTLQEAISHGLCEVIERDAVTLWKLAGENQRRRCAVDAQSINSVDCLAILERFRQAGLQLRIWDVTSDLGVASYCCLVDGGDDDWADPEFGAGCHPNREVALLRALTEAAQARATFIAGARDDLGSALYTPEARRSRRAYCSTLIANHPGQKRFSETPTLDSDTIGDDVNWLQKRLQSVGLQHCLVVDLSRDDFGMAVVRVVVPGLEGPCGHEQTDYVPGTRALAVMPFSP